MKDVDKIPDKPVFSGNLVDIFKNIWNYFTKQDDLGSEEMKKNNPELYAKFIKFLDDEEITEKEFYDNKEFQDKFIREK